MRLVRTPKWSLCHLKRNGPILTLSRLPHTFFLRVLSLPRCLPKGLCFVALEQLKGSSIAHHAATRTAKNYAASRLQKAQSADCGVRKCSPNGPGLRMRRRPAVWDFSPRRFKRQKGLPSAKDNFLFKHDLSNSIFSLFARKTLLFHEEGRKTVDTRPALLYERPCSIA